MNTLEDRAIPHIEDIMTVVPRAAAAVIVTGMSSTTKATKEGAEVIIGITATGMTDGIETDEFV